MTHIQRSLTEGDFYEGVPSPERVGQAEEQLEIFRRARLLPLSITRIVSYQTPAGCLSTGDSSFASRAQIYEAIEKLYLSRNMPRDRRIADRLTTLYRDAVSESENIRAGSVAQFVSFFLRHIHICVPKITLTPDGTVRSRWIHGSHHFFALEFTGDNFAKIVAELPREKGETARYFGREQLDNVLRIAEAMSATVR